MRIWTYMHLYVCVYTCMCAYLGGENPRLEQITFRLQN